MDKKECAAGPKVLTPSRNCSDHAVAFPSGGPTTGTSRCVAPGQAAVIYDGSRVLGGGWIAATGLSEAH